MASRANVMGARCGKVASDVTDDWAMETCIIQQPYWSRQLGC